MRLDIQIDKDSDAWVRVIFTDATPDTRDEPGTPAGVEVIEAWFGASGADAMPAFDAFGIDILSMYESVIEQALAAEFEEIQNGLAQMHNIENDFYRGS